MSALLQALMRRGGYLAPESGGEGGGSGGASGVPNPPEPQSFSVDYVRELRAENKGYRLKHQEAEAKLAKALADLEVATKGAEERVTKAATEAQTAADQRVIRAELKAAAIKAGMVDLDGLKRELGCGSQCGSCVPEIRRLLASEAGALAANA